MARNRGTQFEWAVFHTIAAANKEKFKNRVDAKRAAAEYKLTPTSIRNDANNAVALVQKQFGPVTNVEKLMGTEKTDLIITTKNGGPINCSLKYGDSSQLSSASIPTSVAFMTDVIEKYMYKTRIDQKTAEEVIKILGTLDESIPPGINTQPIVRRSIDSNQELIEKLREVLGTAYSPKVSDHYKAIKEVIVKEAMTGEVMYGGNSRKVAKWVLSERSFRKIDDRLIEQVADRTSVSISLKGRGKTRTKNGIVRLNEVSLRLLYHR